MAKRALGYIASHPFWDKTYIPQRIQNNLVYTYSEKNNYSLVWSIPEVSIGYRSTPALNNFLESSKQEVDSVIFISYQMNHPLSLIKVIRQVIKRSIEVHFVIENCNIKSIKDLEKLKTEIKLSHLLSTQQSSPLLDYYS